MLEVEWFADFVKEIGFPAAVAAFVLIRLNGKMDRLVEALHKLEQAISTHLRDDDKEGAGR